MDYPVAKDPEAVESTTTCLIPEEYSVRKEIAKTMWLSFGRGFNHYPKRPVENFESFLKCADEILELLRSK